MAAVCVTALFPAQASWLDSDFYCRAYGCVIVHDGVSFDVYDVYDFSTGGEVAPGQRLLPWNGNPFQGVGPVNPVFSGTRDEGFHINPGSGQGILLGVDQTGDGVIDLGPSAGADGFLDAGSVFQAFDPTTGQITAADDTSLRSFYLSSRTDFYLSARAVLETGDGELGAEDSFSNIGFSYGVTRSGNDAGMAFGADTRNGNYIRDIANASTLADIAGAPTYILEFRNAIRRRDAADLPSQSVRFDYTYGFQRYDLSLGAGRLDYRLEFDFYNR